MTKLAAYPKCYEWQIIRREMTLFDWIEMAEKELDVDGLEIYLQFFESFDKSYLATVVEAAEKAGFRLPMMLCSPDLTHPDADERKRQIELESQMIEVASFIGQGDATCRVLTGQRYPNVSVEQGIEWVVDAIQQLVPVAREFNVTLVLENHYKDSTWLYPEFALKADVFLRVVNAIDEQDYFGIQFDPSNAIVAGDDPIALLEQVKNRVRTMHASDRYLKNDLTPEELQSLPAAPGYPSRLSHGVIGQGLNDYPRIFQILSSVDFDGWISIEDGMNGIEEMQESVLYLREQMSKHLSKKVS